MSAPLVPLPRTGKLDTGGILGGGGSVSRTVEIATLEISIRGRWEALSLSQRLIPYHSFLVQYEPERWVVNGQAPGYHGERLADALSAIEEWLAERPVEDVSVRVDGRPVSLARREDDLLGAVDSHGGANLQRRRRRGSDRRLGSLAA